MEPNQVEAGESAQELEYYHPHNSTLGEDKLKLIRTRHLGSLYGIEVYAVNGQLIRDTVYVDYTNGGNYARYAFVPEGEIWVDQVYTPNDFAATVVHEFVETYEMVYHKKSYDEGHEIANRYERLVRSRIKNKKMNVKSIGHVIPYLNQLLKLHKRSMHPSMPTGLGVSGGNGDFGKFAPDHNTQF